MISIEGERLIVSGPATIETHVTLREESEARVTDAELEIDLAGVTDVDSSALALVFFWQRRARRITLVNPPRSLLALADLYGVVELLRSEDPPAAAPAQ